MYAFVFLNVLFEISNQQFIFVFVCSVGNIFDGEFRDRFRASIHHSGKVLWEPGGTFRTICEVSINAYPFDHQTCDIVFANWQYTKDQVNLTSNQSKVNMETYTENGEWEIEYTKLIRAERSSESHPSDKYPEVHVCSMEAISCRTK